MTASPYFCFSNAVLPCAKYLFLDASGLEHAAERAKVRRSAKRQRELAKKIMIHSVDGRTTTVPPRLCLDNLRTEQSPSHRASVRGCAYSGFGRQAAQWMSHAVSVKSVFSLPLEG